MKLLPTYDLNYDWPLGSRISFVYCNTYYFKRLKSEKLPCYTYRLLQGKTDPNMTDYIRHTK